MRRLISLMALVILPISIGIFNNSAAMSWIGFFFAILFTIAMGATLMKKSTTYSIQEARAYLDKIEREG